ncbi:potassium channel family protein [Patescibacteria group bacterium]|nr:potassium channel family protein [Patescibacteria group bacterium]
MHKKQFKISIVTLLFTIASVLVIGSIVFHFLEGWSFIDSFYFVTMTATTVGYGDFIPTHNISKIVTTIYSLSIIPFVLYAFSIVAKFQTEHVYRRITGLERKQHEQEDEIEKTERKLAADRRKLKEAEEEIEKTERKLREQARQNREQEKELLEHEKELKGHQRKIKKAEEEVKEVSEEVAEHDKELEVMEDVVGSSMAKK